MEEKKSFNFKQFIEESKTTLMNPKEHFSNLKTTGGVGEPLIKALIYGVAGGILAMLWALFHLSGIGGMFMGGGAIGALISPIIGSVIGLFIGGLIIMLLSLICGGSSEYEAGLRVTASLMVLLPVSVLLSVFGFLGFWVSSLLTLAVNLYGLYLLYHALTLTLKGKEQLAKVIGYVLGALLVLSLLMGACTRTVAHKVSNRSISKYEKKYKKWADALEEEVAEYAQEYEKLQKEIETAESYQKTDANIKPKAFPQKAADEVKELFKEGDVRLNTEIIKKLETTIKDLKTIDKENVDEMLAALERNGYNDLPEYMSEIIFVSSSFEALKQLVSLEEHLESSKMEGELPGGVSYMSIFKVTLGQTISLGNLTLEDVKAAYKNWDELDELMKLSGN